MPSYRTDPSRADRTGAIAAVIAVHAGIAALILASPSRLSVREQPPDTILVDIPAPEPPPPPPPEPRPDRPKDEEGAAGKRAEPSPIVAPEKKLPNPQEVAAAPVAGQGSASTAGAATAGTGTGAGGSGTGRGGGGSGGGQAQWLSGGLRDSDYPRAALGQRLAGTVSVRFTVLPSGRISNCRAVRSSGSPLLDDTTCRLLTERLRFRPATDGNGRPIASTVGSDYTWGVRDRRR